MDTNLRLRRVFFLQVFSFWGINDTCQLEGDFGTFLSKPICVSGSESGLFYGYIPSL